MSLGSSSAAFFGAAGAAGAGGAGYEIERSLRFNSADSAYMSKTFSSSPTDRKKQTFSFWVKFANLGGTQIIFRGYDGSSNEAGSVYYTGNGLYFSFGGSGTRAVYTDAVYRDPSAWYHVVVKVDSTTADPVTGHYAAIYVNGVQQTTGSDSISVNAQSQFGLANANNRIGCTHVQTNFLSSYLAEIHFIDGQALDPTDFGQFDARNVWQPIQYVGTYGTNGFYLPLTDNSSASALGTDSSGNGNDWTVNNLDPGPITTTVAGMAWSSAANTEPVWGTFPNVTTIDCNTLADPTSFTFNSLQNIGTNTIVTYWWSDDGRTSWNRIGSQLTSPPYTYTVQRRYLRLALTGGTSVTSATAGTETFTSAFATGIDSLLDSPTNGDPTLDTGLGGELSGNYATMSPNIGKVDYTLASLSNGNLQVDWVASRVAWSNFGLTSGKWYYETTMLSGVSSSLGNLVRCGRRFSTSYNAFLWRSNGATSGLTGNPTFSTYETGDVLGIAIDVDNEQATFYKNGTVQGTGAYSYTSAEGEPIFVGGYSNYSSASSLFNFGQRPYTYQDVGVDRPSADYKSFCTANLTDPTIADGSAAMDVTLYPGNGNTQSISGLSFSPGLVWTKQRNSTGGFHALFDPIRGIYNALRTHSTGGTYRDTGLLTAFNSDGFSIGSAGDINGSSGTYVAWTWYGGTEARYSPGLSGTDLRTPFLAFESGSDLDDYDRVARLPGTGTITWTANNNVEPIGNVTNLDLYIYQNTSGDTVSFTINGSSATPSSTIRTPSTAYGIYGYRFAVGATVSSFSFTQGSGSARLKRVSADGVDLTESINTDGSLPAAVNANPSTGFSAVRYRGTGATQTIGHGLGVTPSLIICYALDGGFDWGVYHESLGNTHSLRLNTVQEAFAATVYWNDTSPTSSVFTTGGANITGGAYDYIAYCWAPVEGYSAFGGYTATAQSDGPFIYTGFRPRWVLIKSRSNTSSYTSWGIFDSEREPNNADYNPLFSTYTTPEGYRGDGSTTASLTQMSIDKLSNGFKIRNNGNEFNPVNNYTYVYAAFAENPFKYARAR